MDGACAFRNKSGLGTVTPLVAIVRNLPLEVQWHPQNVVRIATVTGAHLSKALMAEILKKIKSELDYLASGFFITLLGALISVGGAVVGAGGDGPALALLCACGDHSSLSPCCL